MPAKNTKAIKSNIAKSTGQTSLLNKKIKFNWKIAAVIGVVLVVALGYLLVRLSQAGSQVSYTWSANNISIKHEIGKRSYKQNGTPIITSVNNYPGRHEIYVEINSNVGVDSAYCFNLSMPAQAPVTLGMSPNNNTYTNQFSTVEQVIATGQNSTCFLWPGNKPAIYKGFWALSSQPYALLSITRHTETAAPTPPPTAGQK